MKDVPIIILHGWGLSGAKFFPLAKELEQQSYQVFSPDLPGFGKAAIPSRPLRLGDYADFLQTYLEKRKLTSVVVIGHSFGGRVALKFQELYPKSVRALILSGTPGFVPVNKLKLLLAIVTAKLGKICFNLPLLNRYQEKARLSFYQLVGAKDYLRAEDTMRQTFKNIVREPLDNSMKAVRSPVLLLWGAEDKIIPLRIAERMFTTIPQAKITVIPRTGHNLVYREPALFAQEVKRFIENI